GDSLDAAGVATGTMGPRWWSAGGVETGNRQLLGEQLLGRSCRGHGRRAGARCAAKNCAADNRSQCVATWVWRSDSRKQQTLRRDAALYSFSSVVPPLACRKDEVTRGHARARRKGTLASWNNAAADRHLHRLLQLAADGKCVSISLCSELKDLRIGRTLPLG